MKRGAASLAVLLVVIWPLIASAQEGGAQERVAALKQSIEQGQVLLRQYEWVETTAVSVKGEEKSRTQKSCYYGADGKLAKVDVSAPPPPPSGRQPRGVRGAVAANKKEEMTDYMKSAVALVHQYVPPDPATIQAAAAAGKLSIQPGTAGQPIKLAFRDYLKPGDTFTVLMDATTNHLRGVSVTTYLDSQQDAVTLDVNMAALPDGAAYSARTVLDATAKEMRVTVENGGHRKRQ